MIRVVIAEDHHVVRAAIAAFLEKEADIDIVEQVADATLLEQTIARLQPDVLLLDAHMPGHRVIDTARTLRQRFPNVQILVLSAYHERAYVVGLIGAGACGYVLKDDPPEALAQAVRAAAAGHQWLSPRVLSILTQQAPAGIPPGEVLTERELDVLHQIAQGCRNDQIAQALCISEFTVKNHLRSIFGKLGVKTRTEAALYAVQHGLVAGQGDCGEDIPIAS